MRCIHPSRALGRHSQCVGTLQWAGTCPLQSGPSRGRSGTPSNTWIIPWTHMSQPPKLHIEQLNRF